MPPRKVDAPETIKLEVPTAPPIAKPAIVVVGDRADVEKRVEEELRTLPEKPKYMSQQREVSEHAPTQDPLPAKRRDEVERKKPYLSPKTLAEQEAGRLSIAHY